MNTSDCLNIHIRYNQETLPKPEDDKYELLRYIEENSRYAENNKDNYELIINNIFEFTYFLLLKKKIARNLKYPYDNYVELHNWNILEHMRGCKYYQYNSTLGKYYQYSYELFEKDPDFWKYVIGYYNKPHCSKVKFTEDIAPPELNITNSLPEGGIQLSDHYILHNSIKLYVERDIQNIDISDIYHDLTENALIDDIVKNCIMSYEFLTKFKHILPWKQIAMFNKTDFSILKHFIDSRYHAYNYCLKSSIESDEQLLNKNKDINYINLKLLLLNKNIELDLNDADNIEFIKQYQYSIGINYTDYGEIGSSYQKEIYDDNLKYGDKHIKSGLKNCQVMLVQKYGEQIINLLPNLDWDLKYLCEEKLVDMSKINGANYFWGFRPKRHPCQYEYKDGTPWTRAVYVDINKKYLALFHNWIYADSMIIVPEDEEYIYLLGEKIENPYNSLVDRIIWYDENSNRGFTPIITYVEFDKSDKEWKFYKRMY